MPQTILTINNARLQPSGFPEDARRMNGKFGASKTFRTGAAIGRKTSDNLLYPCVSSNAIQNVTPSAAATAGTFTITLTNTSGVDVTTSALAYNASIATIQTALDTASGVANGVVASSAGSVAPMSNGVALVLTFSGTGYSALEQPLVTVDYSLLTGATLAVTQVQPNTVQTIVPTTAAGAGHFSIGILRPTGVMGWTGPLAYNASVATIQTALDLASGVANGVVASGTDGTFSGPQTLTLTFSGTGYAGLPQPLAQVALGGDITNTTKVLITDTTVTKDGTEVCVGFAEFGFVTDANSQCYMTTGTAAADLVATSNPTMPYFVAGTFKTDHIPGWRDKFLTDLGGRYLNSAQNLFRIP